MKKILDQTIRLNNGVEMPVFGYGTYLITDPEKGIAAIKHAINYGYKMIDTADIYHNHSLVAKAIEQSNVKREELFITSKIWITNKTKEIVLQDFERILKELKIDYLDLLLVHWPLPSGIEIYKALEEIYQSKKVRAIGVSNFMVDQLEELMEKTSIVPMVNQVELHPQWNLSELLEFAHKNNIVIESWQTIMKGQVSNIPLIQQLATKYNVDGPSIALRWAYQKKIVIIPKSETPSRIESNASNLEKFSLTDDEIKEIDHIQPQKRMSLDPHEFNGEN